MDRKRIWLAAAGIVAVLLIGAGILIWMRGDEEEKGKTDADQRQSGEQVQSTAMYVPYGENSYIMVDQENGVVYTVTMPEEIYDIKGRKITAAELEKGNILTIYGDGIMLESYPGQYPGVTKIEVEKKGDPSDADQYQELIDEIYQEPDPAEHPSLNMEYRTDLAVVSAGASEGGYQWTYEGADGQSHSVTADASHILEWDNLIDLTLDQSTELRLQFSEIPKRIEVTRWPSEFYKKERQEEQNIPEGEKVSAEETKEGYVLKDAEPGYVYLVTGVWDHGRVEYGFLTK